MVSNNVKQQITQHYSCDYFNCRDMIKYLKNNKIDNSEDTAWAIILQTMAVCVYFITVTIVF